MDSSRTSRPRHRSVEPQCLRLQPQTYLLLYSVCPLSRPKLGWATSRRLSLQDSEISAKNIILPPPLRASFLARASTNCS
eukprot:4667805-Pyramimonas_sp.AAC.1